MRRVVLTCCCLAVGAASPQAASAFNGNICAPVNASGALAATHVTGPCVKLKTVHTAPRPSPIGGTVGSIGWWARWGTPSADSGPHHLLTVSVTRLRGSGAALAVARKRLRLKVIGNGEPVGVGKPGSFSGDTSACENPPTDACVRGELLAIVHGYVISVGLVDAPPGIPGAEAGPPQSEGEIYAQEQALKGPMLGVAAAVAGKL